MFAYLIRPRLCEEFFTGAQELMTTKSDTDFGFHFCILTPNQVKKMGVLSFKVFANFRGNDVAFLGLPGNYDSFLFDALEAATQSGTMIAQHAEKIELVWPFGRQRHNQDCDARCRVTSTAR